jgi:hypothetical protein
MYILIFSGDEREGKKEVLVNIDHISKIEVEYGAPGDDGSFWRTSVKHGHTDPETRRVYRLYVDGEVYALPANPGDPVMKVIEEIYNSAAKG